MSGNHDDPGGSGLSFERADFGSGAEGPGGAARVDSGPGQSGSAPAERACMGCQQRIAGEYYLHGQKPVCAVCRANVLEYQNGGAGGSFSRAALFGLVAAALGALIYYAVAAISGYEIGIVSILVGVLVGKAVRRGAGTRSHYVYRLLSVGLAYLAIVSTYVPAVREGLMRDGVVEQLGAAGAQSASVDGTGVWVVAVALSLVAPLLLASEMQIMGLVILVVGLWQAYQLSAPRGVQLTGPFMARATGDAPLPSTAP